jgi:hypothetical protein
MLLRQCRSRGCVHRVPLNPPRPFPAPRAPRVAAPSPPTKLRHGVGQRRRRRPRNHARACRWISGVHLRLDNPILNNLDLILTVRSKSGHLGPFPRPRPHPYRWARLVTLPHPAPLTSLACLSARTHAPACTHALTADLSRRSVIGWLRTPHTPSRGDFVKEPLSFLEIEPVVMFLALRPLVFYREASDLYFYHRNMSNLVF